MFVLQLRAVAATFEATLEEVWAAQPQCKVVVAADPAVATAAPSWPQRRRPWRYSSHYSWLYRWLYQEH